MTPIYQLAIDGIPLALSGRLISLSVNDKPGMEADMLTVTIDDSDGLVAIPDTGVTLSVSFGFRGQAQYAGDFVIDEVEHGGAPDQLVISGSSANFRDSLLEEREESYDDTTLGAILSTIAQRNELTLAISDKLKSIAIAHLDQTNESDANLVSRLAKQYGAVGTIKAKKLLFIERGTGKAATGETLPTLSIVRQLGDKHSYRSTDREKRVTGVVAYWQDTGKAKRQKVTLGEDGYRRHLKATYASEAEATAAAKAELRDVKSRAHSFEMTLVLGRAEAFAEQPVRVSGYKPVIDALEWVANGITHNLSDSGFTTRISCEVKASSES